MTKLRQLSFDSFDQVIEDIQQLRAHGYSRGGQWNLTKMSDHLAKTLDAGMHGGIKPMPWLLRATIGKLMTEYIVKTGHMPSGYQAPSELQPVDAREDDPVGIDACVESLRAARDFQGPLEPHPFCLGLSLAKWKRLMLVHCAHHFSYLQPNGGQSAE